jgi:RNA polymerase sigma-70 factor, ECF subfamily
MDDLVLLDRWCAGNKSAGQQLVDRHFESVYRFFVNRCEGEADDLVQETFAQCTKSRDTFRRKSSFRTYLFAIAWNVLRAHWRGRAPSADAIEEVSIASLSTTIGTRLDRARRIHRAMAELPLDQQTLLHCYYWEDCTREELAVVLDVEPATIGSRLFRARKALQEHLANTDGDEAFDKWARSQSS